ncbi:MAG TPA: hypothetical protein VK563_13130 [Puia sp.]|nr:hypothetical protein [Puia sp.]
MKCSVNGTSRFFEDEGNWVKWWPWPSEAGAETGRAASSGQTRGTVTGADANWVGGSGLHYKMVHNAYHAVKVRIGDQDPGIGSTIMLIPLNNNDSVLLHWECNLATGMDPISRIVAYRKGVKIRKDMDGAFSSLRSFLEKDENIYGVKVNEGSSNDTLVMATRAIYPLYPATNEIYAMLKKINAYIVRQGAMETGYPIMNVTHVPDSGYRTMVAIPVNKTLEPEGDIFPKHIVPWKFLIADVTGGEQAVIAAEGQMQNYISDYHRTVMAIHYQTLVTDRSREPDSTKWVTRLFYPVF